MKNKVHAISCNGNISKDKSGKSIHECLKWVLVLGQYFGQMPVIGVSNSNPKSLRFSVRSWRFLYCIICHFFVVCMIILYLYLMIRDGVTLNQTTEFLFHFNTFIITSIFLKLATEWSKIMTKWISVEFSMRNYGYPQHLQRRINIMAIIVLHLALIEHLNLRIKDIVWTFNCKGSVEFLEFYYTRTVNSTLFKFLGYSIWLAIPLQIANLQLTFAWTFNDLFIILISSALAVRFRQVAGRLIILRRNLKTNSSMHIWREVREDYNRLCNLTNDINESLSYAIIISFANNLYFILIQLFYSMGVMTSIGNKVYFYFSFGFLILRFVWVCIYGAWIYDESRKPISILCTVPSEAYNMEILRLIQQIKYKTVALTGKNFFYITRGLIIRMAGAIVTYELVLIQYNGKILLENKKPRNQTSTC